MSTGAMVLEALTCTGTRLRPGGAPTLTVSHCSRVSASCHAALQYLFVRLSDLGDVKCFWCGTGLPYNSIEILVLGNITNTGSKPVNLKGGWMIIPFSMGVHTQFEGIWKRQSNPTDYFKIFCW